MTESKQREIEAILVSLRDPDDPIARQEQRCFAQATGLASLELVFAIEREPGARELEAELLLFGGSGAHSVLEDAPWVRRFLDFLPRVAERGVPAWASCFAFQGMALAMGGEVCRDDARQQLGVCPVELTPEGRADPLFGVLPDRFQAQFGHHDHVTRVPTDAVVLARGNGDAPQAYRLEGTNFWGAQFHPELLKQTTIERWEAYRPLYAGDSGDEIDRRLRQAPDTPEVQRILRQIVCVAASR